MATVSRAVGRHEKADLWLSCKSHVWGFSFIIYMSTPKSADPVKEANRLIRLARSYWDEHRNHACRTHREMAMKMYESLSKGQKGEIPQVLRVWLRYRL